MALENWELSFCPNDKDKNRWRLKLKIGEPELAGFVAKLPGTLGRPFLLEDEGFDFGLYVYSIDEHELDEMKNILNAAHPGGVILGPSKEEALDALLEKVAKGLDNIKKPDMPDQEDEEDPDTKKNEEDILKEIRESLKKTKEGSKKDETDKQEPEKIEELKIESIKQEFEKLSEEKNQMSAVEQQPVPADDAAPAIKEKHEDKPSEAVQKIECENKAKPAAVPAEKEPKIEEPKVKEKEIEKPIEIPEQPKPPATVPDKELSKDDPEPSQFQPLRLNPRYIFEEFIIGPNNRFTAAAAQAVADNPGKIYNPFFIYSGVGLGKTHLMHAVGHYVRKRNPEMKVVYLTTEKFMGEVIDSIRQGNLTRMREFYRQADLLLVDDIQFLVESESTQEEFFHTFNVLHQNGKQIIVTSDRPPKQLTTLEDRLRSRFEWGLIADIKMPNLETRVAILKKKGEVEKLQLSDNILLYIASKLKSNIRELEGFLKRINAYAQLTHHQVDMELVKSLMSDLLPADELDDSKNEQAQLLAQLESQHTGVNIDLSAIPMANIPNQAAYQPPPAPVAENPAERPLPSGPPVYMSMEEANPEGSERGVKTMDVAFFFPDSKQADLAVVKTHFAEVIKKHKLKFKLNGVIEKKYSCSGKINYAQFAEQCKEKKLGIVIVLGPPPDASVESEDFSNLLTTVMEDESISFQFIPWAELNKDYRYLNLALDITLLKHGK